MPRAAQSAAPEALELAASAGLVLDPWQSHVLTGALGETAKGTWAARSTVLVVPRQNGKGSILEARELAGLYLFGERLILHSAHEFKTASEAFLRLKNLIVNTPDLMREVAPRGIHTSHGEEGIELRSGARIRFVARSTGSGRGFGGDLVVLDEAYNLPAHAVSALAPTALARPNAQYWYTSSAPLPRPESDLLRRFCRQGRHSRPRRRAYYEWCADPALERTDPKAWAQANPGLGIRITPAAIEELLETLDAEDFDREVLGIYPDTVDESLPPKISAEEWAACSCPHSQLADPVVLAAEVASDRSWSQIAAAGRSDQGGTHVEIVDNRPGTSWVVERLVELVERHRPSEVLIRRSSPAASLLVECETAGLDITTVTRPEYAAASGAAYDQITDRSNPRRWYHIDQPELTKAVGAAIDRKMGDAWVFEAAGDIDISPLVAVTVAAWAAGRRPEDTSSIYDRRDAGLVVV